MGSGFKIANSGGTDQFTVTENEEIRFAGSGATSVAFDSSTQKVTISSTDNNTTYSVGDGGLSQKNFTTTLKSKLDGIAASANNYSHPTYNGDDFSVDTGALTGATIVSDIDINVTTDGQGHVTDANGSVATRTLTLANLGYTGATNANNFTYSLPAGSSSTRGGFKIGYSENGKNYPVEVSSEKMYVNVPWTDNNTTYSVGDGGLTSNNFTDADHTKLNGIATGATNTAAPHYTSAISVGDGGLTQKNFTTALKAKLDAIPTLTSNTDVDTGTETVISVDDASIGIFFDYVVSNGTNLRAGTVTAVHDGTNVEFTETSTADLGNTTDLVLSVDLSGGNVRLRATAASNNWSVKTVTRLI